MSIKTVVKEHFAQKPLTQHWEYFFSNGTDDTSTKPIFIDDNLTMRRFSSEDLESCVELFKKVFSDYPWYDEWVSQDQAQNYLLELIRNPVFEGFVVCEELNIVAVCLGHRRSWWLGKEFFVDEFFVENEKQGNGFGTILMEGVSNHLADEGYTRLTLLTNKNIPAESFYLKNGFYNNEKRTVMVKEL